MHLGTHHRLPSRVATRLLLLLALAAASLTLTHCRMVGDRLTGLQASPLSRSGDCVKRCNENASIQLKDEKARHQSALANCNGNAGCIAAENTRYAHALDEIKRNKDACRWSCHEQGGGGVQ